MLLALIAVLASPPVCLANGTENVTLTGTIHVATDAGDPARHKPGYRYARLALDKPLCVRTASGTATVTRRVELVEHAPNVALPFRFDGHHVSVAARRVILQPAPDAPLSIALEDPTIAPAQD